MGINLSTPTAGAGARYKLQLSETSDITDELIVRRSIYRRPAPGGVPARRRTDREGGRAAVTKVSNIIRYVDEPVAWIRADGHDHVGRAGAELLTCRI